MPAKMGSNPSPANVKMGCMAAVGPEAHGLGELGPLGSQFKVRGPLDPRPMKPPWSEPAGQEPPAFAPGCPQQALEFGNSAQPELQPLPGELPASCWVLAVMP